MEDGKIRRVEDVSMVRLSAAHVKFVASKIGLRGTAKSGLLSHDKISYMKLNRPGDISILCVMC